jgi:transposase
MAWWQESTPHKDVHVAVVLDRLGHRLGVREFPATDAGNEHLLRWLAEFGPISEAGVEGTGSYGYRLARLLGGHGVQVVEINCPNRSRRRRKGKSDPVDAENAARAVLAGDATALPKNRHGLVAELRLLVSVRRSAVKARTQAGNQIKSFLVEADDQLRASIRPLRKRGFGRACAALEPADSLRRILAILGRRWLALDTEARELEAQITALITAHAPQLLARHGVGPVTAAQLLVTAGSNPDRLRGDAALAALCGASPVEASSGNTSRHRLNRGGDRAANNALWVIAHVRTLSDPRTRAFVAKRTTTGNSRKEIMRMLQRYIARELYPLIIDALRNAAIVGLT